MGRAASLPQEQLGLNGAGNILLILDMFIHLPSFDCN